MLFLVLVEKHNSKRWQKGLWSLTDCKVEKGWTRSFHSKYLTSSCAVVHKLTSTKKRSTLTNWIVLQVMQKRQRDKNLQRKFAGLLQTSQRAFPLFWDFPDVPVLAAWKTPPWRILICLIYDRCQFSARLPRKNKNLIWDKPESIFAPAGSPVRQQ